MNVHFVMHEAFEAPGAYESWVDSRGHSASYTRVYENQALPESVEDIDLLVVLGGPQSPATTKQECPHFDAAAECALIARAVDAGKAIVGICLGSQLIGEALGATYSHSPEKEIGQFPITMTEHGKANPKFADFPASFDSGHWHSDMPGLTPAAKILAFSEGCPRQIIEYSPLVYGFQCHLELTTEVVDLLIEASEADLAKLTSHRFVQQPPALRANDYTAMNQTLFTFLDKLVAEYRSGKV